MRVLISFIGKSQLDKSASQRGTGRYKPTLYDFSQVRGGGTHEASLFGIALLKYLKDINQAPDRWVILGTPQSSWDALLESVPDNLWDDTLTGVYDQITQAVANSSGTSQPLTQALLDRWAAALSECVGTEVVCRLIGYNTERQEQMALWDILQSQVRKRDLVVLDVSHGFRHLPMLTAFMTVLLAQMYELSGLEVYYGAMEMQESNEGRAPVVRLDFASELVEAIQAVGTLQNTGDYEPLGEFLFGTYKNLRKQFEQLAFEDEINDPNPNAPTPFFSALEKAEFDPLRKSLLPLFQERLQAVKQSDLADKMVQEADLALEHRNYLVAVIMLWEAISVMACRLFNTGDVSTHDARQRAREALLENDNPYLDEHERSIVLDFRDVRNAMVHGTRYRENKSRQREAMKTRQGMERLYRQVRDIYDQLKECQPNS